MRYLAVRIAQRCRARKEPAIAPVFGCAKTILHLEILAGLERPVPALQRCFDVIRMNDAGGRLEWETRQTFDGSPGVGDPVRVYVDDAPAPVSDKNEIRRGLGYVKIPEFANLTTSRPSFVPLV